MDIRKRRLVYLCIFIYEIEEVTKKTIHTWPQKRISTPPFSRIGAKSLKAAASIVQSLCTRATTHGVTLRSTAARSFVMKAS